MKSNEGETGFDIELDTLGEYAERLAKQYPSAAPTTVKRLAACERQIDYHVAILEQYPSSSTSENAYEKLVPIWLRLLGLAGVPAAGGNDDEFKPVRRTRETT